MQMQRAGDANQRRLQQGQLQLPQRNRLSHPQPCSTSPLIFPRFPRFIHPPAPYQLAGVRDHPLPSSLQLLPLPLLRFPDPQQPQQQKPPREEEELQQQEVGEAGPP
jgi:hypothetical protein